MDPRQQKIERDLGPLLAGDLRTDPIALALFSTAACIFRRKPLAVVSPRNESDVARVVEYAASAGVPVTARGGGSSLAGQALGPGIILDFAAHMHRVVDVDADRRTVRVEPGAIHTRVQKAARGVGLRLGPDPSSGDFCTIGGNVGTNASGAHTLRHGSTKDHVLGMTVVLHDGSVARLGTHAGSGGEGTTWHKLSSELTHILREGAPAFLPERPRSNKNSCGFDLWGAWAPGDQVSSIEPRFDPMRLIVGSEGTLGIVTDVTMRLVPKPKATAVALLYFASWEDATEAVLEARRLGASAIEAMASAPRGMTTRISCPCGSAAGLLESGSTRRTPSNATRTTTTSAARTISRRAVSGIPRAGGPRPGGGRCSISARPEMPPSRRRSGRCGRRRFP